MGFAALLQAQEGTLSIATRHARLEDTPGSYSRLHGFLGL